MVLVEAYPHSNPIDIDSILFIDRGKKALGQIFDVIGPVSAPIYCIRFNTNEDIKTKGINVGDKAFCAPRTEYTSYVVLSNIMGKGSDASWKNDIEPPENLVEYSDDEQERKSRKSRRGDGDQQNNNRQRRQAQPRFPHQNNFPPQQQFPYHPMQQQQQQQQHYPNYPMSWHQQQPQSNYNSFRSYDKFFQQ